MKISIPTGSTINGAIYYITKLTSPPVGSFEPSVAVNRLMNLVLMIIVSRILKILTKCSYYNLIVSHTDGFIIANSNPVVLLSDARTSLTLLIGME